MELSLSKLLIIKSFLYIFGGILLIYLGSKLDIIFVSIGIAVSGGYLAGTGVLQLIPISLLTKLSSSPWIAYIYWLFWLFVTLAIYSKEKLKRISDENL